MQPNSNSRPVMDVTTSSRPAVATEPVRRPVPSLPVREAPASPEGAAPGLAKPIPEPPTEPRSEQSKQESPPSESFAPLGEKPAPQTPSAQSTTPVGAITAAIFGILTLAALAILVYLKS